MKILNLIALGTASALLISGCNSTPTPPNEDAIDTTLPVVTLNGHIEDMKSVAFEWKDTKDPRVNGIYVYRSNPEDSDPQIRRYATIPNRFATHFVDTGVKPDTKYQYFFTTFSDKAQGGKSETVTVNTLPVLQSVAWIQCIQNMPRSVKILWRPHTNPRVNGYILERKSLKDDDFKKIAHIDGRLNAEYIDTDLKDGQVYKYRLRAVTYDDVVSTPSIIIQAVTKPLPHDVQGLMVTNNLPKKIRLSWQPSDAKDFDYYKIYRGTSATGSLDYYAKVNNNEFTDAIEKDGKQYFYKVTVVDKDGLESDQNVPALQGLTLSKPKPPAVIGAKIVDNKAELKWSQVDPRTKTYTVIKTSKKGWLDSQVDEIKGIPNTSYTDPNIYAGVEYIYQVIAVDENNIESEPSSEVKISSDELPPLVEQKDGKMMENKAPDNTMQNRTPAVKDSVKAAPDLDTSSL
ncbi:hypothetical protein [Sulfurimonas sp. HSL-1716]|uniref:fibronectin type III domain-containing protein n=1 Tax=Hydrocurvibacter sulfurireducens TaxID=3131937 RepID=UPI0031F810E4